MNSKLKKLKNNFLRTDKRTSLGITSSSDLIMMCRKLNISLVNNNIYMRDELSNPLAEGAYILNLDSSEGKGTHWTAFIKKGPNVYYFDPFGYLPPGEQMDVFTIARLDLIYSVQKNQDIDADSCGYWCVYWLYYMLSNKINRGHNLGARFKMFGKQFSSKNQKENEAKLKSIINKLF